MSDKLPEWPVRRAWCIPVEERALYLLDLSEAALARMEDLAAEVEQLRDEFLIGNPRHAEWLEIINAKLAACERSVAAQPSGAGRRKS